MGETAGNLQREIEYLRAESDWITDELEQRARDALDVRRQLRKRPYLIAAGVAAIGGLATAGYFAARRRAARRSGLSRALNEWDYRQSLAAVMKSRERGDGILKRIVWAMLSAGMVALFGVVARRLSATIWQATLREQPPKKTA